MVVLNNMNQLQLLSPTTRLRKELRRRRREKKMGISRTTTKKAPSSPIVTPKIHSRKAYTTTKKKKKPPIDRSKTPLLTCWSSDEDSESDWERVKRRIRHRNAQRKNNQAPNVNDIDWGCISSSDEESFTAIIEKRKLVMSTRKGTRRALQQSNDCIESTFSNLGLVDNHKQTISHRRRNHTTRSHTNTLYQENLPQEVKELDEYEAQVYNSMKLSLRGGTYDSNRTLCELIRLRRNDVSFASRKANKEDAALEDLQTIWGVGPYRSERFGNEILDSLDSKKNTKLLKLSRKKGMVRFGMRIDKAMKRLEEKENSSQNIRVSRTQPKLKAVDDDDDDDCSLPLPKYVAYSKK